MENTERNAEESRKLSRYPNLEKAIWESDGKLDQAIEESRGLLDRVIAEARDRREA